jgi:hypothetical protein
MRRAPNAAIVPTTIVPTKVSAIGAIDGLAKLGCTARNTMAHTSWNTSRPMHRRPAMLSTRRRSCRYLATSSVDDSDAATPRYSAP